MENLYVDQRYNRLRLRHWPDEESDILSETGGSPRIDAAESSDAEAETEEWNASANGIADSRS